MSKHSVTIRGLRVVTICWSWACSNRTSPSKWIGLGSPLAASSVYEDLTCSVHTVNNLCMFNCQCHFYLCNRGPYVRLAFVPNMLSSWNKDIIIIKRICFFFKIFSLIIINGACGLEFNSATRQSELVYIFRKLLGNLIYRTFLKDF